MIMGRMERVSDRMSLILASSSPRRLQLLGGLGYVVQVIVPDVDETQWEGESPYDMVVRLAKLKANAVILPEDCLNFPVVAADTTVYCDNVILGKPRDLEDAVRILQFLSGKDQKVITGYAVKKGKHENVGAVTTHIRFRVLSQTEIIRYVETGECLDKAGAYGIQGLGAGFVSTFTGSYTNVIGLPLDEILVALDGVTISKT